MYIAFELYSPTPHPVVTEAYFVKALQEENYKLFDEQDEDIMILMEKLVDAEIVEDKGFTLVVVANADVDKEKITISSIQTLEKEIPCHTAIVLEQIEGIWKFGKERTALEKNTSNKPISAENSINTNSSFFHHHSCQRSARTCLLSTTPPVM